MNYIEIIKALPENNKVVYLTNGELPEIPGYVPCHISDAEEEIIDDNDEFNLVFLGPEDMNIETAKELGLEII